MSLRDHILAADDLQRTKIHIPEWGAVVWIRTLTGRERDRFEGQQSRDPYTDIRARLAVMCLVDEDGKQLFSAEDIPALTAKSSRALDRVFAVAVKLSGISKEDVEELKKA